MKLLDFSMPPFARIVWASKETQGEWEPKFKKAARAFSILEQESVVHGLRACTTAHIEPERMIPFMQELSKKGLIFQPMRQVGAYTGFAHAHPPVIEGLPWTWYGVVSKDPQNGYAFAHASSHTEDTMNTPIDHCAIGDLLGYPKCCQTFFNDVWGAGYIDPIWQQADSCREEYVVNKEEYLIQLKKDTPWETSSMLRYIGIRLVPHIPCSHDCDHSYAMAQSWLQLGKDLSVEGMEELEQFLRMPIEWDCLKGTAYVSTPIFKLETNSMTCYPRHVVQKEGTFLPSGKAKGLKFPFIPMGSEKFAHLFGGKSGGC